MPPPRVRAYCAPAVVLLGLLPGCSDEDAVTSAPPAVSPFLLYGHDGTTGIELYRSDGTSAGTTLLADIGAGGADYPVTPRHKPGSAGTYAFLQGGQAWMTDGTTLGTLPAAADFEWSAHSALSLPDHPWLGDKLLFQADGRLWSIDSATGEVAALTADDCTPRLAVDWRLSAVIGGTLYFFGKGCNEQLDTLALWRTDGTLAGTAPVSTITAEFSGTGPDYVGTVDQRLVFVVDDGTHGSEPWTSDGTTGGTRLLADLASGTDGSDASLTGVGINDLLLFSANGTLYATDGSPAGTVALPNEPAAVRYAHGTGIVLLGGAAWFLAVNSSGDSTRFWLRTTDGTPAGTHTVMELSVLAIDGPLTAAGLAAAGNRLYVRLGNGSGYEELQAIDPLAPAVQTVMHGAASIIPWAAVGDRLAVSVPAGDGIYDIWSTRGTPATTRRIAQAELPVCPVPYEDNLVLATFLCVIGNDAVVRDDTLFFLARDALSGNELWRTDGTAGGTRRVTDIWAGDGAGVRGLIR